MSKTYFNISDKLRLYEFDGMLDQYGDAAAAYSLRKLRNGYTGDAIRVRRSSDDAERDMGFYDNELDTVALLDWVNAEYIRYESDFRLGGDNFSTLDLQQLNGESIAGEDNAAKFTLTGGLSSHYAYRGPTTIGQTMKVTGRYYIPSTNSSCNAIRISGGSSEFIFANTLDEWAEFEHITTATVSYAIFRAANGTNTDFDGDGDVFYLKDLVYTQITADGHVHTWYDQSTNANHAVQGTATAQPKIVSSGTIITEGTKPSLLFNGSCNFNTNQIPIADGDSYSIFQIEKKITASSIGIWITQNVSSTPPFGPVHYNNGILYINTEFSSGRAYFSYGPLAGNNYNLISGFSLNDRNTPTAFVNNTAISFTANTDQPSAGYFNQIGARQNGEYSNTRAQEIIIYKSNQLSNRTGIETNINTYYNIY